MFQRGEWAWSLEYQKVCRVVETQDLWASSDIYSGLVS